MRRIILLAFALTLSACSGSTEAGEDSLPGTYSLVSVDGQKPPIKGSSSNATPTFETLEDRYVLRGDGTYTQTAIFRITDKNGARTTSDSARGSYFGKGSTVTFTYGPTTYNMSYSKNTLTRSDGAVTIYKK